MKTKKCDWCNERATRVVYREPLCEKHYKICYGYPDEHKFDYTPKEILTKTKPF